MIAVRRARRIRRGGLAAATVAVLSLVAGCAMAESGTGSPVTAPPAQLTVHGDSGGAVDTQVKNALSDVLTFWKKAYPEIGNGDSFPALQGSFYSVDGLALAKGGRPSPSVAGEACMRKQPTFVVDNAAYCELDDSVIWDRSPQHLLDALSTRYGDALLALVFAHELGHAVQARLDTVDDTTPTIDAESQADCAAGAFAAYALAGHAPHFRMTQSILTAALEGYLLIRDSTPESPEDISHGNGFDRLSAVQDGIEKGARYCYSDGYFASRNFTERGLSDADRINGGNQSLSQVLDANDPSKDTNAGGLQFDLNRFWTAAGKLVHQPFAAVRFVEATHPKCGASGSASQFGYCPDDNTVYYNAQFASDAYHSITELNGSEKTGNLSVVGGQPGDFALGELISVGWGMAAQHQFFGRDVTTKAALLAAVCYSGAYAASINVENPTKETAFVLSAPDMDEATSAVLSVISQSRAFGPRGTSALDRVKSFVTGYAKGLSGC